MHVAYLCCFQVIRSCWRANWKKPTLSSQTTWPPGRVDASRPQHTTRPPGRVEDFTTSPHRSTPWPSTPTRVTRSLHSTPRSSVFTSTTWPSLDHTNLLGNRVSPPPLDYILDGELQILLHSALNQTLEHKEEKKTPAIHSTSHSTTWVEYSS